MSVKLADTLAPMAEFPVALAENIDFVDGENLQQKLDEGSLGGSGTIDSELNINSTNAVQNRVVTEKFGTTQKSFELVDAGPYEEGYFIITPPLYSHFILSTKYGEQVEVIGGSSSDSKYNAIRLSNSLESEGNRILHIYVNDGNNVLFLKVAPDTSLIATGLDEIPVFRIASLPDSLTEIPIETLGGATIEVDSRLDPTSTNPVQNQVIADKFQQTLASEAFMPVSSLPVQYVVIPLFYQDDTTSGRFTIALSDASGDFVIVTGFSKTDNLRAYRLGNPENPSFIKLSYQNQPTYHKASLYVERTHNNNPLSIYGASGATSYTQGPLSGLTEIPIESLGGDSGKAYTSLAELGLTSDATIDDVRGALKVGESCLLRTDTFSDLTQFNGIQWGYLKITVGVNKMSDIWLNDVTSTNSLYYGRQSGGLFHSWVRLSSQGTYTELVSLGLTADATVDDVLDRLQPGEAFICGVTQFTNYQTLFPYDSTNDQYSRVFIQQGSSLATAYLKWFRKDGSREALGNLDSRNKLVGWNEVTMSEIIHASLTESLAGITTTLDLVNALITEYRAKNKPVKFISGSITKTQLTDLPSTYGLLDITVAGYDLAEVSFARSEYGYKILYHGFLNRVPSETLFSKLTWSKSNNIYYTIEDLNAIKGTAVELVKGEDNTLKIIQALGDREEFVEWFNNGSTMDRFGIPDEFGNKITYLRIIRTDSQYALIIATTNRGFTFSRVYNQGVLEDWCYDKTKATLITNATNLKLDITKRNTSWYGSIRLTYLYDTSPVEVEIDFRAVTDPLRWTVAKGQKYINSITFTQDTANKAHYTIGIAFSGTTYGCYQAEVIGAFADINSLTADAFTGDTTATYGNPYGKNNGVTLVSAPEDIGVTSPCTSVQLVQAMRNTFNKTVTSGAIGVFNNGGSTITDAPADYGLLHIEVFGHDRTLIRFDGIGGSTYSGSWIGKVQGNNGTFSSVKWERVDNKYSTGEIVVGEWIDGSPVYRKTITYTFDSDVPDDTSTVIGNISGSSLVVKLEGILQKSRYDFKPLPFYVSSSNRGSLTFLSSTGNLAFSGSAVSSGAQVIVTMEYLKT